MASAAVVGAVVETVSVAVAAVVPVMLTGLVVPKLRVGRSWAFAGLDVMDAVRSTFPVKPPLGVIVMVEVFPLVAPALTATLAPLTASPGGAAVTMTVCVL